MKRTLALILSLAVILCCSVPAAAANTPVSIRPSGICKAGGEYIITDIFNKQILKGSGTAWTVIAGGIAPAGASGEPLGVYKDGPAQQAYFTLPWAVVPFMDGYAISDTNADVVRYLVDGTVRTLVAQSVGLTRPTGLATDGEVLYIADTGNGRIVMMKKDGTTSVVASGLGGPTGLAYEDGKVYICETDKNRILVLEDAKVSVVAGRAIADDEEYAGGYVNGKVSVSQFDHPKGICASNGVLYVSDDGNLAVRRIANGLVSTVADAHDVGYKTTAPREIAVAGDTIIVADVFYPYPVVLSAKTKTFSDVEADAPEAAAIEKAVQMRLIGGFPDGSFRPEETLTRAQFVTMIAGVQLYLDGQAVIDGDPVYEDITGAEWYAKNINWATASGLLYGRVVDGKRIADPKTAIKVKELSAILSRFAQAEGIAYAAGEAQTDASFATRAQAVSMLVEFLEKAGD